LAGAQIHLGHGYLRAASVGRDLVSAFQLRFASV
jgi:hypothetical protein